MIQHIHIIHGPNLNLLGKRETDIYGSVSFDDFLKTLQNEFPSLRFSYFQSNHEGHIIDYLHRHGFDVGAGFLLNAGGLTHTSVSLRDAVAAIEVPVIEIHISNIFKRESFRWHSYLTDVCAAHFIGQGLEGYRKAVIYLLEDK